MHALQFVQAFATFAEQDYASLRVIDRALAEKGLRAKAKGKRLPDVALGEGVMFLLAVLANQQPTRAADAALELASSRCIWGPRHSKSAKMLASLIACPVAHVKELQLIDVVAMLCRPREGTYQWAELSVHRDGPAFLSFGRHIDPDPTDNQLAFYSSNPQKPKFLTEARTASPGLLKWIGENTVDDAPKWISSRRRT